MIPAFPTEGPNAFYLVSFRGDIYCNYNDPFVSIIPNSMTYVLTINAPQRSLNTTHRIFTIHTTKPLKLGGWPLDHVGVHHIDRSKRTCMPIQDQRNPSFFNRVTGLHCQSDRTKTNGSMRTWAHSVNFKDWIQSIVDSWDVKFQTKL